MEELHPLVTFFASLSVLSVGGIGTTIPEISGFVVDQKQWLSQAAFSNIYALSEVAPGPSNLIVAMIGFKVAGFWGALLAQLAILVPATILMHIAARFWTAGAGAAWHDAVEEALGPIVIGLIFAASWTVAKGTEISHVDVAVGLACTLLFWRTNLNPLPVLALAAGAGYLGWM